MGSPPGTQLQAILGGHCGTHWAACCCGRQPSNGRLCLDNQSRETTRPVSHDGSRNCRRMRAHCWLDWQRREGEEDKGRGGPTKARTTRGQGKMPVGWFWQKWCQRGELTRRPKHHPRGIVDMHMRTHWRRWGASSSVRANRRGIWAAID